MNFKLMCCGKSGAENLFKIIRHECRSTTGDSKRYNTSPTYPKYTLEVNKLGIDDDKSVK